jgi:hypothetical protein
MVQPASSLAAAFPRLPTRHAMPVECIQNQPQAEKEVLTNSNHALASRMLLEDLNKMD